MEGNEESSDHVIAELVEMGFEFPKIMEAVEAVGASVDDAIEFILNGSQRKSVAPLKGAACLTSNSNILRKRAVSSLHSLGPKKVSSFKQPSIKEQFESSSRSKRIRNNGAAGGIVSGSEMAARPIKEETSSISCRDHNEEAVLSSSNLHLSGPRVQEVGSDWEQRVNNLLTKHFGFSSLKSFQKKALEAWLANQDCLVLAATGSGKSLCFQIPALLTGKVVVAISPLISLMHDQCLSLARHGVSACFLGSGQSDSSVEQKAMNGLYDVVYVCPETIMRLIQPLQRLAENRGIALFAIDEVHCVSKWGHDFRPDYRRLSILRENFRACNLRLIESDIPLMALTATATLRVRDDILKSLCMSKETKIVLTSFFRSNLQFSVKHSATSSTSSYEKDFRELVDVYTTKRETGKNESLFLHDSVDEFDSSSSSDSDQMSPNDHGNIEDEKNSKGNDGKAKSLNRRHGPVSKEKQLSIEYLEDELDVFQSVDDFDVPCGEFCGRSSAENEDTCGPSDSVDMPSKPEERLKLLKGPLGSGPTIIYVPTRKETLQLAKYLCNSGVKAAAYNAKLPKTHLRQVHKEFHENALQVVVATIAFGMGIDKSNVRRIIHYGWPQSLEAYYQEAGRAGRDGKLADCVLYANLSKIPTLLPSQRSAEQTKQAYRMLSDCFRYGMGTATCRAKTLVEYFGEDFNNEKCLLCDVCVDGPPAMENLKEERDIFMRVLASNYAKRNYEVDAYDHVLSRGRFTEKPNLRMVISGIREQFPKFAATDRIWWQGLSRILQDKGYIREGGDMTRVCIKFPEPTDLGLRFLNSEAEVTFNVYPEADMLLSKRNPRSYSSFSEWGRGWADPEIRCQRLQGKKYRKKSRKKRPSRRQQDLRTVRGRLTAKLSISK